MKLYKFRSFENIELTLDIIMNERLYCAYHKDQINKTPIIKRPVF
jgi:hypothetical protein